MKILQNHSGLTLFGIYWTLFFSFIELILGLFFIIFIIPNQIDADFVPRVMLLIIGLTLIPFLSMLFSINLYLGKIKDYILVGFISLIPSLAIGGIFIIIDGKRSMKQFYAQSVRVQTHDSLEYKLKEIENLRQRGIISKEEYDLKRSQIISKY